MREEVTVWGDGSVGVFIYERKLNIYVYVCVCVCVCKCVLGGIVAEQFNYLTGLQQEWNKALFELKSTMLRLDILFIRHKFEVF